MQTSLNILDRFLQELIFRSQFININKLTIKNNMMRQNLKQYYISVLLTFAAFMFLIKVHGQVQLNLTIPKLGSPYLSDYIGYESSQVLIISNTTAERRQIFLRGKIEQLSSPGYYLQTRSNFKPNVSIALEPFETKTLFATSGDFAFLEERNLEDNIPSRVRNTIKFNGILPEGEYQICIQAFDFVTEQAVSLSEPSGCQFFVVTLGSPPQLIHPICSDTIDNLYPNFVWTPAISIVPLRNIEYTLYIVEYNSRALNPTEVMEQSIQYNAGNPIIIRQLLSNSYLFSPTDLPLRRGSTYIVCAVATDRRSGAMFENNGRSEICLFHTSPLNQTNPIGIIPNTPTAITQVNTPTYFNTNNLKGKLRYYWNVPGSASLYNNRGERQSLQSYLKPIFSNWNIGNETNNSDFNNIQSVNRDLFGSIGSLSHHLPGLSGGGTYSSNMMLGVQQQVVFGTNPYLDNLTLPTTETIFGAKALNFDGFNQFQNSPLAGVTVALVLGKQLMPNNNCLGEVGPSYVIPKGQTLATAITQADGSFGFNVPLLEEINFSWQEGFNADITGASGNLSEMVGNCSGYYRFRNVLMVSVITPQNVFGHPVQAVSCIPDDGDMGTFFSMVRTFDTEVYLTDQEDASLKYAQMEILLLQELPYNNVYPKDALTPGNFKAKEIITIQNRQYEIAAREETNSTSKVNFQNIPYYRCGGSGFFVSARPVDNYTTDISLNESVSQIYRLEESDWSTSTCLNNSMVLKDYCKTKNCYDIGNNLSTLNPTPNRKFYHTHYTTKKHPRVYTKVINGAASGQMGDLAQAEPGVNWRLWRITHQGMEAAKQISWGGWWGQMIQSPLLFENMKNSIRAGINYNEPKMSVGYSGTTGSDGRIDKIVHVQRDPYTHNQIGYYFVLEVFKEGFKTQYRSINRQETVGETGDMLFLAMGKAYKVEEIVLEPEGQVELYFKDQANNNVKAKQVYYIDQATGQTGEVKQSVLKHFPNVGFRQTVTLIVPSGMVKIVVVPENENEYAVDTISVQVPSSGILKHEVIVPFKLHRIQFLVKSPDGNPVPWTKIRLQNTQTTLQNNVYCPPAFPGQSSPPYTPNPWESPNDNPLTLYTDGNGIACFVYKSGGTNFNFRITAHPDKNLVVMDKSVHSVAGKYWKKVDVTLKQSRTVKGQVRFNEIPVADARVRVKGSNPLIEVKTNENGYYEMKGVAKDTILTFTASKSGYVGTEYTENMGSNLSFARVFRLVAGNTTTINYELQVYDGMDLTRILGFPVEITALQEKNFSLIEDIDAEIDAGKTNTGHVEISGLMVIENQEQTTFAFSETNANDQMVNTVDFDKLKVIPDNVMNAGGLPYAKPQTLPMTTSLNHLEVAIFTDKYFGTMGNQNQGLVINQKSEIVPEGGFLQGEIRLNLNSFQSGLFSIPEDQEIRLRHAFSGLDPVVLPAFPAIGTGVFNGNSGIQVCNKSGGDIAYKYHNVNCIANTSESRLKKDSLSLDSRIVTDFQYVTQNNINLPIGLVCLIPGGGVKSFQRNVSKNTLLAGDFNFDWTKIAFNDSGVRFDGTLRLRSLTLPVSNGVMESGRFSLPNATLAVDQLSLMDIVPLTIAPQAQVDFGYDAHERNAWYLNVSNNQANQAAAMLSGQHLPGIPNEASINVQSLWLYSNGFELINLLGVTGIRVYSIADFSAQNFFLGSQSFKLSGGMDLGIPGFTGFNTALVFDKNPQGNALLPFKIETVSLQNRTIRNLIFGFHPNDHTIVGNTNALTFSQGQIIVRGTVTNPNKDIFQNLKFVLTKTNQKTEIEIDESTAQSIKLGADPSSPVVLSKVAGKMIVNHSEWGLLHLRGDMPASLGFHLDNLRVRYEVKEMGGLAMENQAIRLQNMDGDIGGMNMQYDMQNHRLMGSVNFAERVGDMDVEGQSEIVIDKYGYYFLGAGSFVMSNPNVEGQAFLIFGDYAHKQSDLQSHIESSLRQRSYYYANFGELPEGFTRMTRISGFYFSAGGSIPFPVLPNFDLNVGIAQAKMEVNIGAEVRVGIQFGNVNSYNLGFGVFIDAEIGVGASVVVACAGVEIYGRVGVDFDGTYWSNGNYSITAQGFFNLGGCAWFGGGLACDSNCDGLCVSVTFCGQVRFGIGGTITQSNSNWSINFDADNTSEQ